MEFVNLKYRMAGDYSVQAYGAAGTGVPESSLTPLVNAKTTFLGGATTTDVENLSAFVQIPAILLPQINRSFRLGGSPVLLVVCQRFFGSCHVGRLGNYAKNRGIYQEGLQAGRAIDRKIQLFYKDDLLVAMPICQHRIKRFPFHKLA